ncbi:NAD(P)/FAD-dependent oxidoreductase [Paenibacillus sp. CAU 1782]
MQSDCAIIGGGPAGLQAALVLGRARRSVALMDDNRPRNAVTHASHSFLTRDGVKPAEFRRIAYNEVLGYPSVTHYAWEAKEISLTENGFVISGADGHVVHARKVLVATGLREILPEVEGLRDCYGKSLFNCPFCDGWEMRDQPLVLFSEQPGAFHMAQMISHWSKDLVVCTNGSNSLSEREKEQLRAKNIIVMEQAVSSFVHREGKLEAVAFADGGGLSRTGGFVASVLQPRADFHATLRYERNELGGIATDSWGKSGVPGLFAAGDAAYVMPSQLIFAAADGARAAMSVHRELMEEEMA